MTEEEITHVTPDEDFNRRQKAAQNDTRFADLERLASWMDAKFTIPGTNIRYGIDPLIGLVPVAGDTISLLVSGYIVGRAYGHGVPRHIMARMIFNIMVDWFIGDVPVLGDMFDVAWKANIMNVNLLKKYAQK